MGQTKLSVKEKTHCLTLIDEGNCDCCGRCGHCIQASCVCAEANIPLLIEIVGVKCTMCKESANKKCLSLVKGRGFDA